MEHEEIIKLEKQGKLVIGIDRGMARKFYTSVPIARIDEETGEAPYTEKMIVLLSFILGPIAVLASILLGFFAFGWWGIISMVLCPVMYFGYQGTSSRGGSRIIGITIFLLISVGIHFLANLNAPLITGFAVVFIFSLWCARFLYCSSTFFLRAFILRNRKAFEYLSNYFVIRNVD